MGLALHRSIVAVTALRQMNVSQVFEGWNVGVTQVGDHCKSR